MNNYFKKIILFFCIFCAFVMPLRSNIAKANPIAIGAVEFAEGSLGGVVTGGAGYAGYDIIDRYKKEASDFIIKKSLSTLTNTFLKFYSDSSGQKYVGIDGSGLDELQSMLEDMRHSSYEGIPVFTNKTTDKTTYVDPFTPYMLNGFYMKPYSTLPANSIYDSFKISYGDTVSFFCYSTVDPSITGSASFTPINDCYIKIDSYTGSAITFRYSYDNSSWKLIKLNNGSINYINTNRSAINFIGYKTTSDTVYIPTTDVITGNGIDGKASDSIGSGVIAVPVSGQYQDDGTVIYTPIEGANVGVVSGLTKETSNSTDIDDNYKIKINKDSIDRIFNSKQGHLTSNTTSNRKILEDAVNYNGDIIGVDEYKNEWYTEINSNGTQTWAEVTNGEIVNGGVNEFPIKFDVDLFDSTIGDIPTDVTTGAAVTVEDLMNDSTPGRETKGRSELYERSGDFDTALKDFENLHPKEVKDISIGKVGKLEDGTTAIVRSKSSDGRPTLEIQKGKSKIKFRYSE